MLADPVTLPTLTALTGADGRPRCPWARGELLERYHDDQWGTPLHGDVPLYEKLTLEAFQSGLSWLVVLRKRDAFRAAFGGFVPETVAAFDESDVERLLGDAAIIRNRLKIEAAIANGRAIAALRQQDGEGALDRIVWSFAAAAQAEHVQPETMADVPPRTSASKALAVALRAAGVRFVGPITAYALMQSIGVVDDHVDGCWRAISARRQAGRRPRPSAIGIAASRRRV